MSVKNKNMLLTEEQKQKYLAYLENRKKGNKTLDDSTKLSIEPTDLICWCVDDIIKKNNQKEENDDYYQYILEYSFNNLHTHLEKKDIELYSAFISEEELDKFYISILSLPKYVQTFSLSVIFAYMKLCFKLGIESNFEIEAIADSIFQMSV